MEAVETVTSMLMCDADTKLAKIGRTGYDSLDVEGTRNKPSTLIYALSRYSHSKNKCVNIDRFYF